MNTISRASILLTFALMVSCGLMACNSSGSGGGEQPKPSGAASRTTESSSAGSLATPSAFSAGAEAPDFALVDLQGQKKTLKDFRGKWVLLNFWATWCVPCIAKMAALERLSKVLGPKGFTVLGVNMDEDSQESAIQQFLQERGLSFPVLRDPENKTKDLYQITGFPETFLIAPDGKFVSVYDESGGKREVVRVLGDRPWDSPVYTKAVTDRITQTGPK